MDIEQLVLRRTDGIPNSALPAIVYRGVFEGTLDREALARAFESLFGDNGWPAAWRNGVFAYDHFHCDSHEVLGIYDGRAELVLGGENGPRCVVERNDAVVIPAGVSHRRVRANGRFACVGAYPSGQGMGFETPSAKDCDVFVQRVERVALPSADPVLGIAGAIVEVWRAI